MDASKEGLDTWKHAFMSSGALGIYGDFIASETSSYGHHLAETLAGPVVTGLDDLAHLGEHNGGVKFLRNNTPVASTLWATKAAFNRLLLDQLQYIDNPKAHQEMRAQEMRIRRDTNQGYWWRPGAMTPDRLPEFTMGR